MSQAWSTIVTREPEWDDLTRSRALSLVAYDSKCCPSCATYDSMVPIKDSAREVTWPDGSVYTVKQLRCQACGASETVRRDFVEQHKDHKPVPYTASPADGLKFIIEPGKPDPAPKSEEAAHG